MNIAKKRRSIDDYFVPSRKRVQPSHDGSDQRNVTFHHLIPGLSIIHEFATHAEEQDVLAFLDAQQWRTDLARRVIHYGGTYCLMPPRNATPQERKAIESNIITADPVPEELQPLIERMIQRGLYTTDSRPEYCIVNEYKDSQGISAHVENFRFKSPVCGLTLCKGDYMRFHELIKPDDGSVRSGKASQAARTGRPIDVWMSPRSLLVMSGEARKKWQHEIVRGRKGRDGRNWRRVSLTFRTDKGAIF